MFSNHLSSFGISDYYNTLGLVLPSGGLQKRTLSIPPTCYDHYKAFLYVDRVFIVIQSLFCLFLTIPTLCRHFQSPKGTSHVMLWHSSVLIDLIITPNWQFPVEQGA